MINYKKSWTVQKSLLYLAFVGFKPREEGLRWSFVPAMELPARPFTVDDGFTEARVARDAMSILSISQFKTEKGIDY